MTSVRKFICLRIRKPCGFPLTNSEMSGKASSSIPSIKSSISYKYEKHISALYVRWYYTRRYTWRISWRVSVSLNNWLASQQKQRPGARFAKHATFISFSSHDRCGFWRFAFTSFAPRPASMHFSSEQRFAWDYSGFLRPTTLAQGFVCACSQSTHHVT